MSEYGKHRSLNDLRIFLWIYLCLNPRGSLVKWRKFEGSILAEVGFVVGGKRELRNVPVHRLMGC